MSRPFTPEIAKYIKTKDLDGLIEKLHKNIYISKDRFESKLRGIVTDFEWNHLDQSHRLYIHDAYHDALRIATSKDIAVSITAYKNLPIYIQVVDMRIDRGLFYQSYTIFGLLFCHQTCRMIQEGDDVRLDIEWRTVSHKWLRFLHRPFNKKMYNLIHKQNIEDVPLRLRRASLRDKGICFKTDEPDFLNSNILSDMVIFPSVNEAQKYSVANLKLNDRQKISIGVADFYVLRKENGIQVWPAICPHEGAEMPDDKFCEGVLTCPWHARKFSGALLQNAKGHLSIGNLELTLDNDELILKVRLQSQANTLTLGQAT